jgi:hypothetical protein
MSDWQENPIKFLKLLTEGNIWEWARIDTIERITELNDEWCQVHFNSGTSLVVTVPASQVFEAMQEEVA